MQIRAASVYVCSLLLFPLSSIASPQKNFEQVFATSVLLTNSDAITFGVSNFDPTGLLNPDDAQQE